MKSDSLMLALAVGVFVLLVGLAGWFAIARFRECRAHGFSALYCVGQ